MYKKVLFFVCFFGVLFFSIPGVLADNETQNEYSYELISANTDYEVANITLNKDYDFYVLTGSTSTTVEVPAEYLDKPVLAISDRAFSENTTITSLDISNAGNLVAIGAFAFKDAVNLTESIEFGESVEVIGRSAFRGTKVTNVLFDDNSSLTTIGESAFAATKSLNNEVALPEALTSLGNSAFASSAVTKVTFGSNIKTIGAFAFDDAESLAGELIIDAPLEVIGDHAFRGTKLTNIDLSNALIDTLLPYTFGNISTLTKVVFPKNIELVSNNTFINSDSITELQFLGSNTVTIESAAFTSTENINKIVVTSEEMKTYLLSLERFNEDVEVEVYTEPVSYTVTFNTNGGSSIESITVEENALVTKPVNPTKEGNSFVGWYKDENLTIIWNFETDVVNKNTVLYAKWESTTPPVTKYTVTFNTNGGSSINQITVDENGLITKPANPTKEDYTFEGWYKDSDLKTAWDFSTDKVTGNITLYAKWNEVEEKSSNTTLIVVISGVVILGLGATAYFVLKNKKH